MAASSRALKKSRGRSANEAANANETSPADRSSAGPTGNRPRSLFASIKEGFRAVARALVRKEPEEKPVLKRRRSDETGKAFAKVKRKIFKRAQPAPTPKTYAEATAYLADTLEWLQLWEDNAPGDSVLDDDYNTQQNYASPQL